MNLWDTLGLTTDQAIRVGIAAILVPLFIGAWLWWRSGHEERVHLDLGSRRQ